MEYKVSFLSFPVKAFKDVLERHVATGAVI